MVENRLILLEWNNTFLIRQAKNHGFGCYFRPPDNPATILLHNRNDYTKKRRIIFSVFRTRLGIQWDCDVVDATQLSELR